MSMKNIRMILLIKLRMRVHLSISNEEYFLGYLGMSIQKVDRHLN